MSLLTPYATGRPQRGVVGFCQSGLITIRQISSVVLARRLIIPERFNWELGSMVMLVLSCAGRWLVSL